MKALEQILSDMQLIYTVVVLTAILAFPPSKVWLCAFEAVFVVAECPTPLCVVGCLFSQFIHAAYQKQALEVRRGQRYYWPFFNGQQHARYASFLLLVPWHWLHDVLVIQEGYEIKYSCRLFLEKSKPSIRGCIEISRFLCWLMWKLNIFILLREKNSYH